MIRPGIRRLFHLGLREHETVAQDVDAEIAHHLELRYQQLVDRGMLPPEARAQAMRQFGDSAAARLMLHRAADHREQAVSLREYLRSVGDDVRFALRGLRRAPSFTLFVVVILALGIGVNSAMFGVADRLFLRGPEQIRDPSRVVRVYLSRETPGRPVRTSSVTGYVVYDLLHARASSFTDVAAYAVNAGVLGREEDEEPAAVGAVTGSFFSLLGAAPAHGRLLVPSDDAIEGAEHVVVISSPLWRRRFGGDPAVIGRSMVLNGESYVIVGVAPDGFTGATLAPVDAWIPMSLLSAGVAPAWRTTWQAQWLTTIVRLKPGTTPVAAGMEATTLLRGAMPPELHPETKLVSVAALGADENGLPSPEAIVAKWLVVVAAIVLLVACSNVINLLLARATRRRAEFGIRLALGAGRRWLVRLVLVESIVLGFMGAAAGLLVAVIASRLVRQLLLPGIEWPHGAINLRTVAFVFMVGVVLALVIGMIPAVQLSRNDLIDALKSGTRQQVGGRTRGRNALAVAQTAMSAILLTGAGLFVISLARVRSLDLGFHPDRVLAVPIDYPGLGKADPDDAARERVRRRAMLGQLVERARTLPGVTAASAAIGIPFGNEFVVSLRLPGRDSMSSAADGTPTISAVTPGYFSTVGTAIIQGRAFTAADQPSSARVAIVSRRMAQTLWPGSDPVGQCLIIGADTTPCARVVGVAADVYRNGLQEKPSLRYYIPAGQESGFGGATLLISAPGDPLRLFPAVRDAMRAMDPSLRRLAGATMQQAIDPQIRPWRVGAIVFTLLGLLALGVATIGLYGLIAYQVSTRAREFGVRIALGARGPRILSMIVLRSAALSLAGAVLGAAIALAGADAVQPLLFNTSARNPVVLGVVMTALVIAAAGAGFVPAWRASHTDPMTALRAD